MPEELLTIGEVAARTGIATSALRYYDQLGLVRPRRRAAGQRRYGPEAAATVAVVRLLREVGFPLAEIKRLLASRAAAQRPGENTRGANSTNSTHRSQRPKRPDTRSSTRCTAHKTTSTPVRCSGRS